MASTYLTKTLSSGNQKIWTLSFWSKITDIIQATDDQNIFTYSSAPGTSNPRGLLGFGYSGNNYRFIVGFNPTGSSWTQCIVDNIYFRDVNAFYHMCVTVDTTQATASDRVKVYVNGEQKTVSVQPTQNLDTGYNSAVAHSIGRYENSGSAYFGGILSHVHWIDGTAYDASTFGESDANGVWKPKTSPSVTYGTNGFFLKFENSGSMGTDSSGNGNNFTVNGSLTQTLDTPSNVYATLNALDGVASTMNLQNGNTKLNGNTASAWKSIGSTLAVNTGKFYWENKILYVGSGTEMRQGICDIAQIPQTSGNKFTSQSRGIGLTPSGNYTIADVDTSYGTTYTDNDILSFALDLDNGALYIAKNGTWMNSGDPTSGASKTGAISVTTGYFYTPATEHYATNVVTAYNFGNGYFGTTAVSSAGSNGNGSIFEYDVPTGYYALNTKNLATYG